MLPKDENKKVLDDLAARYFVDKLGLSSDDFADASNNLMTAFDVLLRIDERLKNSQTHQPL